MAANNHANHGRESSLTLLEGTPVVDAGGQLRGRVADVAVGTGQDAGRVLSLVVKSARARAHRCAGAEPDRCGRTGDGGGHRAYAGESE